MSHSDLVGLLIFMAGACTIVGLIAFAVTRNRGARNDDATASTLQALEQRFARVEVALDDVTTELHRITESHGLLTKQLSDRTRDPSMIDRR
jgi:hypothetical protein